MYFGIHEHLYGMSILNGYKQKGTVMKPMFH
jgi:hypothetical protein